MTTATYKIYKYSQGNGYILCHNNIWYRWHEGLWEYDSWHNKCNGHDAYIYIWCYGNIVPVSKLEFLTYTGCAIESTLPAYRDPTNF